MRLISLSVFTLLLLSRLALAEGIVERRIWIESAIDTIKEEQCEDKIRTWRCLFSERTDCIKAMKAAFLPCSTSVVPDLPEYIDSPETKAQATKVVMDCMTGELTKKYILALPRDKMDEYNVCTGVVARSKPLSANLQKAEDYSKTQTTATCATGGFMRKCFNLPQNVCNDTLAKQQHDCTMKMEADGVSVKKEESAIEEAGRKITDCALSNMRKALDATRKRIKDKDCE
ncbi:MAG: hypothetical protein ACXVB9_05820 [Bdellovibrionota bacterium]